MTLNTLLRAATTPRNFFPAFSAIGAGILLMTLQTTAAQAAG